MIRIHRRVVALLLLTVLPPALFYLYIRMDEREFPTWPYFISGNIATLPFLEPDTRYFRLSRPSDPRANATIISLVRNEELDALLPTMREVEATFNSKFNYPWTFINDKPFSAEFKKKTGQLTKAVVHYETIPSEDWAEPAWIDQTLKEASAEYLKTEGVQYSALGSYHRMCRWYSGLFFKLPQLTKYRYYWRVEPSTRYFCDVDYDVFKFMEDNNKTYGFTINLYDSPHSVRTLWPTTMEFVAEHPEYVDPNASFGWLTQNSRPDHNSIAGYSTCHFWSNFEIADMDFWRSPAYQDYFDYLDQAGGFFYERWGDAPVHSIAAGLFLDKDRIHWFRDIGYNHVPYLNCPNSPKCKGCTPGKFFEGVGLAKENCFDQWYRNSF